MDSIKESFSKRFSNEEKKVAIALWKAKVPLKTVREQCKISENHRIKEIKRLLIIKMDNLEYSQKLVDSMAKRLEEVIERQGASTLSTKIPENRKQWKINCFFQFCTFYVFFLYDRPVSRPPAVCICMCMYMFSLIFFFSLIMCMYVYKYMYMCTVMNM